MRLMYTQSGCIKYRWEIHFIRVLSNILPKIRWTGLKDGYICRKSDTLFMILILADWVAPDASTRGCSKIQPRDSTVEVDGGPEKDRSLPRRVSFSFPRFLCSSPWPTRTRQKSTGMIFRSRDSITNVIQWNIYLSLGE